MRLASIDIGSNTVRLLVADVIDGKLSPLMHERIVTRLAGGMHSSGVISDGPLAETVDAVRGFVAKAREAGAEDIIMAGTSALREAGNSDDAVRQIDTAAGISLDILSGHEEAGIMAMGVLGGLELNHEATIFDIGGGSTELIRLRYGEVMRAVTLPSGVVRLTEESVLSDPPEPSDIERLDRQALSIAGEGARGLGEHAGSSGVLVGTAGTATTLASLDMELEKYDWKRVQGHVLGLKRLYELEALIQSRSLDERRKIPGMDPERADLIIAGTRLTIRIIEALGFGSMTVSDHGLLEGLIIKLSGEGSQ